MSEIRIAESFRRFPTSSARRTLVSRGRWFALVCGALLAMSAVVRAADATPRPLVVAAVASIDRLMAGVETVTIAAERRDLYQTLKGFLSSVGDFDGIDREKPLGVLVFVGNYLPPEPEVIGFLPVNDQERMLKTIAFGPIRTKPVEGIEGRHEIVLPNNSLLLQFRNGHAFIARKSSLLDRNLPELEEWTRPLVEKYDLAASLNLQSIPAGVKSAAMNTARDKAEVEMKRESDRPNAPEEENRLRREATFAILQSIEETITNGREIILGVDISERSRIATAELVFVHTENSAAAPTATEQTEPAAPARLSLQYSIPEKHVPLVRDFVALAETRAKANAAAGDQGIVDGIFSTIKATADAGRLDFQMQFVGTPPGAFSLVGRFAMKDVDRLGKVMPETIRRLSAAPGIENARIDAAEKSGVFLHQLTPKSSPPGWDRIYGSKPSTLLGAGNGHFWFAIGGAPVVDDLGQYLEKASGPAAPSNKSDALRLTVSASSWIGLLATGDQESSPPLRLARDAFAKGKDRLLLEIVSTPQGPAARLELEEGYLRAIGLAIGAKFDGRK